MIGSHCTMERPEPVSLVTPPRIIMAKMAAQQTSSQIAMCLLFVFIEGLIIGSGDPDYCCRKGL